MPNLHQTKSMVESVKFNEKTGELQIETSDRSVIPVSEIQKMFDGKYDISVCGGGKSKKMKYTFCLRKA